MEPPKSAPSGNCSDDLERARQLTHSLRGTPATTPTPAPTGYVSFGHLRPPAAPAAPPPARPQLPLMTRREPIKAPTGGFGPAAWNKLLDACVVAVGADTAFLMDPHGLIVSSRGPNIPEELEGVGARLMVAFDQADRIGGAQSTLSMTVETARGTLHGLRLLQSDSSFLTLAVIVSAGLTGERQARLVTLVTAATLGEP